jgi:hypothetical protein
MKKGTDKQAGDRGKTGAGVFKRIGLADKQSGVADRVRHTAQANVKK